MWIRIREATGGGATLKITDDITVTRELPTAVALGFFDGVHKGHQSVVGTMIEQAIDQQLRPVVFTFEPMGEKPDSKTSLSLLQTDEQKYSTMEKMGVLEVVTPPFTAFKDLTPEQYVKDLLYHTLHARVLVCGENYHFGKKAIGDTDLLKELAGELGITVITVPPVLKDNRWISSTRIRQAIEKGDMVEVEEMLGAPYTLEGVVTQGNKLGRTIDFPTINIPLMTGYTVPKYGVYLSKVIIGKETHWGITNVGVKPTVGTYAAASETFIFDYEGDLYGAYVGVELKVFIRSEQVFTSVKQLTLQIQQDVKKAVALIQTIDKEEVTL